MTDAARDAEIYRTAARLNLDDPLLLDGGSLLQFPDYGQLVMTGDLHGHRRNFEKLKKFCDLERFLPRHVIVHEIVHEEVATLDGADRSHEVLLETARWKCDHPEQVHFLLGNHELAQIKQHEITKNGRVVTADFERAVRARYGGEADAVLEAMYAFIASMPLAGRTPNRVFLSHSLPGPRDLPKFDPTVFSRRPTEQDLADEGSAHMLIWGRYHTEETLAQLREMLDVDFFLCGHQPQETGYDVLHDCMIILASDHNHGVFLTLDLSKPVTLERLTQHIYPFAGVA
ncbi:MAG: hypothetical protein D6788_02245 [Planctomycetota bacterium]|nr:MAG: hypothetical protein D6788_02245 [Planctomycetota bacterium]